MVAVFITLLWTGSCDIWRPPCAARRGPHRRRRTIVAVSDVPPPPKYREGWYYEVDGGLRYWDGERWTEQRAPAQVHVERTRVPPDGMRFRADGTGGRQIVTVTPRGVRYEYRYPNWMTWTVLVGTVGLATPFWKWIQFGQVQQHLRTNQITAVDVLEGASVTTLRIETGDSTLEFETDEDTADAARRLLSESMSAG